MAGRCDDLQVVDFTWWMAGPLATMTLADYGARVIKVEPPGGDPARGHPAFQTWNRGKESIALDLKSDGGRTRAQELIVAADVVVVGFRPGVAERLGIGFEQVRDVNSHAVYATLTGFGEMGSSRDQRGYEALVAAKTGRMNLFANIAPRPGPGFVANPVGSYAAAMLLTQGILAALHERRRTGHGQKVSVSMVGATLLYDFYTWVLPQFTPATPDATKDRKHFSIAVGKTYDSQRVQRPDYRVPRPSIWCGATNDDQWLWIENTAQHLCVAQMTALDLLHLYEDERFAQLPAVFNEDDAEALWEVLLERVRSKSYEEWRAIFDKHEMGWERVSTPVEALQHRQVVHNGHRIEAPGLEGQPTFQPGPLVRINGGQPSPIGPAPRLGEHNDAAFEARAESMSPAAKAADAKSGPLAGLTVIDLSTWLAGAYAPTLLAEMGARVIAVEPLGGEPGRYLIGGLLAFATSQGKESIALDLKQPEALAVVRKLIERADVVYHNYRPGVAERLSVGYEDCRKINPRVVYLNASSYGDGGPDQGRPSFAGTIAAMNGYAARQAGGAHPAKGSAGLALEDLKREAWRLARTVDGSTDLNAALAAVTGILLGLHARERTGEGQELMTTMICSNLHANSDEAIDYAGRPPPAVVDEGLFGLSAGHRLYEASDGWVVLACATRTEWETFCDAVGRRDLGPAYDEQNADAVAAIFRATPVAEWERLAAEHDLPLVAVESRLPGIFSLEDEELRTQGLMVQTNSPTYGDYWRHGALQRFSESEPSFGPWEPVGGHSRSILAELGYAAAEIDRLIDTGIVEAPGAD
jgi:crotonobetainyl-CoA:carnitine CoA-transferase CaiB-like acyl-CoA transferase